MMARAVAQPDEIKPFNLLQFMKCGCFFAAFVSAARAPEGRTTPADQLRLDFNRYPFSTRWLEGLPEMSPEHAPTSPAWTNSVAICASMKDEHLEDVVEWLEYHRCAVPPLQSSSLLVPVLQSSKCQYSISA